MRFHIAFSLLVTSLTTREIFARIPQEVEDEQKCAVKRIFFDEKHSYKAMLSIYENEEQILHTLMCDFVQKKWPTEEHYNGPYCKSEDCVIWVTNEIPAATAEALIHDEYEFDFGLLSGTRSYFSNEYFGREYEYQQHGFAIIFTGRFDGDFRNAFCRGSSIWNVWIVRNLDEEKYVCTFDNFAESELQPSRSQERFPLAEIINSTLSFSVEMDLSHNTLQFLWKGCASPLKKPDTICIRLVNSKVKGYVEDIHPPDVKKAFENIKDILLGKKGIEEREEAGRQHPRQMLFFGLLAFSLLLLIATFASTFVMAKPHDFPDFYHETVKVDKKTSKMSRRKDKSIKKDKKQSKMSKRMGKSIKKDNKKMNKKKAK